ncbi:hypothetical protein CN594_01600, partial [Bacillus toyonensis]|uniref:hypothetical protein n=1 Tax=Bacillus toyonensis TaxID=155322 RepID=UPI000BFACA26
MYLKLKDIHNDEREVNDAFIKRQKNKHFETSHEIPILCELVFVCFFCYSIYEVIFMDYSKQRQKSVHRKKLYENL